MTSMFDYDDSVNLAFDAKIAGKNLVTAKHELLQKTGDFLFLAHSDKELAYRMQMVETDIEKIAYRKLASVSDSKAKLVRAVYEEWQIRHANCDMCKTAYRSIPLNQQKHQFNAPSSATGQQAERPTPAPAAMLSRGPMNPSPVSKTPTPAAKPSGGGGFFGNFVNTLSSGLHAVEDAGKAVVHGVGGAARAVGDVAAAGEHAIGGAARAVGDTAVGVGKGALNLVEHGTSGIGKSIQDVGHGMSQGGNAIANGVSGAGKSLVDSGKAVGQGVMGAGRELGAAGGQALRGVEQAGNLAVQGVKDVGGGVVKGVGAAGGVLNAIPGAALNLVEHGTSGAGKSLSEIANGAKSGVGTADKIMNTVGQDVGKAVNFADRGVDAAGGAIKAIPGAALNLVEHGTSGAGKSLSEIANGAKSGFNEDNPASYSSPQQAAAAQGKGPSTADKIKSITNSLPNGGTSTTNNGVATIVPNSTSKTNVGTPAPGKPMAGSADTDHDGDPADPTESNPRSPEHMPAAAPAVGPTKPTPTPTKPTPTTTPTPTIDLGKSYGISGRFSNARNRIESAKHFLDEN